MDSFESIARRCFLKFLGGVAVAMGSRAVTGCAEEHEPEAESDSNEVDASEVEYDYIVVGSGAGGGPLAANLARQGFEVLLLEAGEDRGSLPAYQVPAFNANASEEPSMRWDYFVRHYDDDAQQARDPKATAAGVYYPRGGTLGGCTAVNALITVYPHESDFQHIAELTGDASWSPDSMRRYYERMEKCDYLPAGTPGHGQKGWLRTSRGPNLPDRKIIALLTSAASVVLSTGAQKSNIVRDIVGDIRKLVAAMSTDLNVASPDRDQTEGLYSVPLASAAGSRNGPREYILRVKTHYKLTVKTRALAAKVVFAPGSAGGPSVAAGVEYLDGGGMDATDWKNTARYRADREPPPDPKPLPPSKTARLKKNPDGTPRGEVILACGVFNTPQLLKLSGVGPKEELTRLGIPVLVDLPGVGKNLQDRYEVSVVTEWSSDFDALNACTFGQAQSDYCYQMWQAGRVQGRASGAYTTGPVAAMITRSSPSAPDPDLVIFGYPANFRGYKLGYSKEIIPDHRHFSWSVLKAHTKNAAGTVTLRSTDPRDTPDIRFRYFQQGGDEDLAAVVRGVQLARAIAKGAPALLTDGVEPATFTEVVPGPAVATPEQIGQFVKDEAWGHHASCTCPIGPRDTGGVLDSRFRVYGTRGLRVVDASVFPKTPGFFLALPIYMASEKAFDVIVEDAGQVPNLGAI
jgi:choline dehydrogenase